MGDIADDIWSSMFEADADVSAAIRAMRDRCDKCPSRHAQSFHWNDDGLLECDLCGQMTDI